MATQGPRTANLGIGEDEAQCGCPRSGLAGVAVGAADGAGVAGAVCVVGAGEPETVAAVPESEAADMEAAAGGSGCAIVAISVGRTIGGH